MDTRNLILAVVLSLAILFGFQYLVPAPKKPIVPVQTNDQPANQTPGIEAAAALQSRAEVLASNAADRVEIETPRVRGSISLKGGRIDDLILLAYHETVDPNSPSIVLLSPSGAARAAVAETGWIATTPDVKVPDADSHWTADSQKLTVDHPVTLTWPNGAGLIFTRTVLIDDNYMFTVRQSVSNSRSTPVALRPYALLARFGKPTISSTYMSYEGPIGTFNGVEEDVKYSAIPDGAPVERASKGGWLGFSDKYWLSAVAPADQAEDVTANFRHSGTDDAQKYQVDYLGGDVQIAPGATALHATLVFAGPKEVKLLDKYRDDLSLPRFDNAVDFGWFWFLTKPIFFVLDKIYGAVGNFGVSILLLTVLMRAIFFPIQTKAVLSMNKMKVLQPEILKLRELYGDDKARLNQETMALYQKAGANPVAGCLPLLVQIPVFFSLYKVLFVTIEMRHAPFFGWIRDLSAPDPTSLWNLFGLVPWHPFAFLPALGVWPLIYCSSMYVQQRLQPQPADPTQARMMQFMPLMFLFMMGNFPAGLMIYYSWSNVLGILQQYVITRHVVPGKSAPAKA